jgi:hypothetical protein
MAQIFKVDFSAKGRYLRQLTKELHADKKEKLTVNQHVFYLLLTQNPELQILDNVRLVNG